MLGPNNFHLNNTTTHFLFFENTKHIHTLGWSIPYTTQQRLAYSGVLLFQNLFCVYNVYFIDWLINPNTVFLKYALNITLI